MATIKQQVEERKFLYKRPQKVKEFRQIVTRYKGEVYGVDLADYSHDEGSNKGFLLCCIDYHTRYAMVKILTQKSKAQIEKALEEIFNEYGKPDAIHSDREGGLINSAFLADEGIHVYHTDNVNAHVAGGSAICERFIKTIRSKLQMFRDVSIGKQWKSHVDGVVDDYNHAVHSTIRMTPNNAFYNMDTKEIDTQQIKRVKEHNENVHNEVPKNIKVDSAVVIPKEKKTFEKGYTQTYDDKILTIKQILKTSPPTYLLSNGKFAYKEELQILNDNQVRLLTIKPAPKPTVKQTKPVVQPDAGIASRTRSRAK